MTDDEMAALLKRASVLKLQSKKHQIFREVLEEAQKLAEAGAIHLKVALALPEGRQDQLKEAAACLSRAKRVARSLGKSSD